MVIPVALVAIAIFLYLKNHFENKRDEKRFARQEHQQETLERLLRTVRKKADMDSGNQDKPDANHSADSNKDDLNESI